MITQERLQEVLRYDPITGDFHWKIAIGRNAIVGSLAGSLKPSGYINIQIGGQSYPAHRLAWYYIYGEYCQVDHKDNRRYFNAIANLRKANAQQNAANREVVTSNSGVKGVHFRKGRYHAGIKVNGIRIHLGCYKTLEEARNVRQAAAKDRFGEFANETETQ